MASRVSSPNEMALYFLAIFLPPLAVFFKKAGCSGGKPRRLHPTRSVRPLTRTVGSDVWINIALWILGWIPGVIHAWYLSPSLVVFL
ncbi:hypothetical protein BGY98DRAFT_947922, partial [Russula aff. rugulosa BPL654]